MGRIVWPGSVRERRSHDRLSVLHVSESFGGGVAASIHGMIASMPEANHTVLILRRRPHFGHTERRESVDYIDAGPRVGVLSAMQQVARTFRTLQPDIVHAQSSYAGAYVRALPLIPRSTIVYTPHCFAFERTDLSPVKRAIIRMFERLLARRTDAILAASDHEAHLAESLSHRWRVIGAVNNPDLPEALIGSAQRPGISEPVRVTAVGRLCPQKDPGFFMEVVRIARGRGIDVDWTWIGDGNTHDRAEMERLGVTVTGWQDRTEGLKTMAASHICLHTAAWEVGVPMTVLEASGMGVPSVVRNLAAIDGDRIGIHVDSPAHAVSEISLLCQPEEWIRQSKLTREALATILAERSMADALHFAYRWPSPGSVSPPGARSQVALEK